MLTWLRSWEWRADRSAGRHGSPRNHAEVRSIAMATAAQAPIWTVYGGLHSSDDGLKGEQSSISTYLDGVDEKKGGKAF